MHISTKLNRAHLITGEQALILPCLGRTEKDYQSSGLQFVSVRGHDRRVHRSKGVLEPASPHLKSEPAIIAGIARATLQDKTTVDWEGLIADYDRIREHIEHVVPGFYAVQRPRAQAGRLLSAQRSAPGQIHDAQSKRPTSPSIRFPSIGCRKIGCC